MFAAEPLPRPAPRLIWPMVYGLILLGWLGLFALVPAEADRPAGFWAALCVGAGSAGFGTLWAMWALMGLAMMLPTFLPALRTYLGLSAVGASDARGAAALVAGYVAVWAGAAVLGAAAQMALAQLPQVAGVEAGLLMLAGAYQFSRMKSACLAKCRMPLTFFMERWRPGPAHALRMGAELGVICLGCCWALMALGLIGGAMNLLWMGAATLFMALEKLPEIGRPLTRPAGWALIGAGGMAALAAMNVI